jgi:hypothetical protein
MFQAPQRDREWIETQLTRYRALERIVTDERALTVIEGLIMEAEARLAELDRGPAE